MDDLLPNSEHICNAMPEEESLAWRRDPKTSFSDWTVNVVEKSPEIEQCFPDDGSFSSTMSPVTIDLRGNDKREVALYHVHRVFMASGPRKSEYFQTLLSFEAAAQQNFSRETRLTLEKSACSVFPIVLDFIYGSDDDGKSKFSLQLGAMEPQEAVALAFLSDFLRIQRLVPMAQSLVRKLLDKSTVHIITREAVLYGIDWIIDECISVAALSPRDFIQFEEQDSSLQEIERPPALQALDALPLKKQNELLKRSLSLSLRELGRFRRVPSRWNDDIDDLCATHMPTLMLGDKKTDGEYRLPTQGCGIPFPGNKICPLFYFDRDDETRVSSPLNSRSIPCSLSQESINSSGL